MGVTKQIIRVLQKNFPLKNCNFHCNCFYMVVWLYN